MSILIRKVLVVIFALNLGACNYVTYTPKSKKNILRETPSVVIFDRIVDFRVEQMGWPSSKIDFMSKGKKYYDVFQDFPYQQTSFKVIDSNTMIFSFSQHTRDLEKEKILNKAELNSYRGTVKFFKENGKFIWKLKMNK